jgi:hypothetical protein
MGRCRVSARAHRGVMVVRRRSERDELHKLSGHTPARSLPEFGGLVVAPELHRRVSARGVDCHETDPDVCRQG